MTDERQEFIQSLRDLADFLETTAAAPLPLCPTFNVYVSTAERFRELARVIGSFNKQIDPTWYSLSKKFGPIAYDVYTDRSTVCERKVVGTKTVPAQVIPEHTEEIVEWECAESILEGVHQ